MDFPMKEYRITSGFGMRWGKMHQGIDFSAPLGTPIYASEDCIIEDARDGVGGFGAWVVAAVYINGRKFSIVYGHMYFKDIFVKKGDEVKRGQLIALVGNNGQSTGPHLHFEIWDGGRLSGGRAIDPMLLLTGPARPATIEPPAGYDDWCCKGQ